MSFFLFTGSMIVNDQPVYTGMSPGRFQGLDLLENMYIGAVPDFEQIPRAAGYRTGFVGQYRVVKRRQIQNKGSMGLGFFIRSSQGQGHCSVGSQLVKRLSLGGGIPAYYYIYLEWFQVALVV